MLKENIPLSWIKKNLLKLTIDLKNLKPFSASTFCGLQMEACKIAIYPLIISL